MPGYIAKTRCGAMLDHGHLCSAQLLKTEAFGDQRGNYWCPLHTNRGWLLNWAEEHNYPEIAFYALLDGTIGPQVCRIGCENDPELWEMAIFMGREAMIRAAFDYVNQLERDTTIAS